MKQGTGILVLLALLLFGLRARQGGQSPPAAAAAAAPAPAQVEPSPGVVPSDERGVGQRLLDEFRGPVSSAHLPTLGVMLATLPDPRASRLDWMFDSHLDALFRAFERAGFVPDRFSLPWEEQPEKSKRVLLRKPGAILFRRRGADRMTPDLWLVFVVGELSTGGIDRDAFHQALVERQKLFEKYGSAGSERAGGPQLLPVLGPVFSGSCASLRRALDVELDSPGGRLEGASVQIVSGASTSPDGLRRERVSFQTTLHTDQTLLGVMQEILATCGWSSRQLAVLQESTTAYGQASRPGASDLDGALFIPFPMNIGSLRRAASQKADRPPPSSSQEETLASIGLDLDEDTRPENPSPASKLSAPSVELLLEEITRMLAQHEIRVVLLFATDVRDKLFLGKELKKRRPDLQLVTTEGNVLYLRPDYNQWLRGMIVLSTYPLVLRDAAWRPQTSMLDGAGNPLREQLMFPNEGAEGTFNAALFQLYARRGDSAPYVPAADYGPITGDGRPIAGGPEIPPVWITVVGASTMLPLSVHALKADEIARAFRTPVPITTARAGAGSVSAPEGAGRTELANSPRVERSLLAWITVAALSLYLLAHAILRLFARDGFARAWLARVPFAPIDRALESDPHRISLKVHEEAYDGAWYLAYVGLLLPGVSLIWLATGSAAPSEIERIPLWLGLAAVITAVIAGVWHLVRSGKVVLCAGRRAWFDRIAPSMTDHSRVWRYLEIGLRLLTLAIGALYLTSVGVWSFSLMDVETQGHALFLHRALELDQGVSPFVPMFLLGGLFVAWCQWHRRRIGGLSVREPIETVSLRSGAPGIGAEVRARLFLVVPTGPGFLLLLAFVASVVSVAPQLPGVMESLILGSKADSFVWLLHFGVLGSIGASVWSAYRLWAVWDAFEKGLPGADLVTALPIRELSKEHGFTVNLGLWPTGRMHGLTAAATRRWRALLHANGTHSPELEAALKKRENHEPCWSLALERATGDLWNWFHDDASAESSDKTVGAVLVLELLLYVEWVLHQIRTLSLFLLLSIVLTTMLIASYPFQPQHLIQTVSLFVFFGTVATLVIVIGAMNRHPTLSHLANTEPNQLTWDRTLFVNLGLYFAVPLLALASAQYPALRGLLFEWIDPLLKSLATS